MGRRPDRRGGQPDGPLGRRRAGQQRVFVWRHQGPAAPSYNAFLLQPFVNYNFGDGWFVGTAPIITANWLASGDKWTLPVGAQVGRVSRSAVSCRSTSLLGAYYNALRPEFGSTWQLRTQVALIF